MQSDWYFPEVTGLPFGYQPLTSDATITYTWWPYPVYRCTTCDHRLELSKWDPWRFCPWCGARLGGK